MKSDQAAMWAGIREDQLSRQAAWGQAGHLQGLGPWLPGTDSVFSNTRLPWSAWLQGGPGGPLGWSPVAAHDQGQSRG